MNEERDKDLTEALGECWHESQDIASWRCNKCGFVGSIDDWVDQDCNNKFSTWSGFGKLWEWAQKQEWWEGFVVSLWYVSPDKSKEEYEFVITNLCLPTEYIHPNRFADAIYEFLKEREK